MINLEAPSSKDQAKWVFALRLLVGGLVKANIEVEEQIEEEEKVQQDMEQRKSKSSSVFVLDEDEFLSSPTSPLTPLTPFSVQSQLKVLFTFFLLQIKIIKIKKLNRFQANKEEFLLNKFLVNSIYFIYSFEISKNVLTFFFLKKKNKLLNLHLHI